MNSARSREKKLEWLKLLVIFAMLGALLVASKFAFEMLPNIHPISALIMVYTLVYRSKALIPIYLFVFIMGLFMGFALWWIPYLYIWTVLWGVTMLLPRNFEKKWLSAVYMTVCGLYGLLYGTLYAPFQAIAFGMDFKATLVWIAAGLPFDVTHAISNFAMGLMILPLAKLLDKLNRKSIFL